MTPAELAAGLERRAAEAERIGATAPVAAIYRVLAAEVAGLNGNGNGTGTLLRPSRLVSAKSVAERLGCSLRYVYAKADTFPFTVRVGGMVRFSEAGLEQFLQGRAA